MSNSIDQMADFTVSMMLGVEESDQAKEDCHLS